MGLGIIQVVTLKGSSFDAKEQKKQHTVIGGSDSIVEVVVVSTSDNGKTTVNVGRTKGSVDGGYGDLRDGEHVWQYGGCHLWLSAYEEGEVRVAYQILKA